jgi:nitrate reductase gamma subunit
MSSTAFLIGGILPYLAIAVFLVGVASRLVVWWRTSQPGTMTVYPTKGSGFGALAKEAMFFPSLFRGDKTLWLLSWSFHVALGFAFVGHLRVVTGLVDRGLVGAGFSPEGIAEVSAIAGGVAGMVLMAAAGTLLVRRIVLTRIREISSPPDFAALLLLVAVITTGNLMSWRGLHLDLAGTRIWAGSLVRLSPIVQAPSALLLHVFCAELMIVYIAFSKLMHFGGFFFTFSLIKRSRP